jgi:hypothetical protein
VQWEDATQRGVRNRLERIHAEIRTVGEQVPNSGDCDISEISGQKNLMVNVSRSLNLKTAID